MESALRRTAEAAEALWRRPALNEGGTMREVEKVFCDCNQEYLLRENPCLLDLLMPRS
jgi:hypothetical protein